MKLAGLLLLLLSAEVRHPELGVTIELPDGWTHDKECGPFVPPDAKCRVDGGVIGACPKTLCPERVGVLWLRSPAVLTSREEEKAELLEADGGWVTSMTLKDGWILTWGSEEVSDSFPFKVSRKIDGRVIECSGEAQTVIGQQKMIEACKSVKPSSRKK
ncbi:MAG: hypothetical protein QM817_14915 [Archangium sp.]